MKQRNKDKIFEAFHKGTQDEKDGIFRATYPVPFTRHPWNELYDLGRATERRRRRLAELERDTLLDTVLDRPTSLVERLKLAAATFEARSQFRSDIMEAVETLEEDYKDGEP